MKLKDYSLQIKKNFAVLLHLLFLSLIIGSFSVMYLSNEYGSGLSWLKDRSYEDSPQ